MNICICSDVWDQLQHALAVVELQPLHAELPDLHGVVGVRLNSDSDSNNNVNNKSNNNNNNSNNNKNEW